MGCGGSLPKLDILTTRTLQEMGISKGETKKLMKLFGKVDADRNGVIQVDEFLDFFDLHPTLVNKLLFSCYDLEGNGEMTFIQFVCTLWSFFTTKQEEMGAFVFFIFDLQKSGEMPNSEILLMAKQMHKKHYDESPSLKSLVSKAAKKGPDGAGDKPLTAESFAAWAGLHPVVCRPVVGKQKDMMEKAFRASFWKKISQKKFKHKRLSDVHHIHKFMNRIRGIREVPKKELSAEEVAAREKQAVIDAKTAAVAADKAEKVMKYMKKNSGSKSFGYTETKEGHQVSYFDVDDIDQLMDNFSPERDEMKGLKKKGGTDHKKSGSGKSKKGKSKKSGSSDDLGSITTTKELPPLVLKAMQKGQLGNAAIAPMDNSRINDLAREKVRIDKEPTLSAEEKKRIFAVKASRSNKKMSHEYDIFN